MNGDHPPARPTRWGNEVGTVDDIQPMAGQFDGHCVPFQGMVTGCP